MLEEFIKEDAVVRLVDIFVDSLDLGSLGFCSGYLRKGYPSYHHSSLLTLFIYGHFDGIRSSRKLEPATNLNLEVMCLVGGLKSRYLVNVK
jgi:transposase